MKIISSVTRNLFLLAAFPISISLRAQDSLTWALATIAVKRDGHEIRVGEKVPEIPLKKIVDGKTIGSSLYTPGQKPQILEFWHQYCSVCRGELPKLNQLYLQYKDSVNFLMVTFQSEASVRDFMKQQAAAGKPLLFPIAVEDTLLRKTFGHDGDPHLVWIGSNGNVQAISNHLALSAQHIQQWLRDQKITLALKSNQKNFDPSSPLLINNNGAQPGAYRYRSLLTGFIDSISSQPLRVFENTNGLRLLACNETIDQLFKDCYMLYDTATIGFLELDWKYKRLSYQYNDSSKLANWTRAYDSGYDALDHFQQNHLYSYELSLPPGYNSHQAAAFMLRELQDLFHINASVEVQQVEGLALVRTTIDDRIKSKGISATEQRPAQDSLMTVQNYPIASLVNLINLNYDFPLVVDETGYTGNIDISIPNIKNGFEMVKNRLLRFGLDLVPKRYALPMLRLTGK